MNEQISWDHSLVKKFSSSNHYKLLNQLRSEVKKYPLIKKKNLLSNTTVESKIDNKSIQNTLISKDLSKSKNEIDFKENNTNLSNINFNNSKNFSLYNNNINDNSREQKENKLNNERKNITDYSSSSTFKDRLNKIDMK